jgi:hypothetical protein
MNSRGIGVFTGVVLVLGFLVLLGVVTSNLFLFEGVQFARQIPQPDTAEPPPPVDPCDDNYCTVEDLENCPSDGDCNCNDGVCAIQELGTCEGGDCCGDGECSGSFELNTCPNGGDCGCHVDGECTEGDFMENNENCPEDCYCGNGECESDENSYDNYCAEDCCGNGDCFALDHDGGFGDLLLCEEDCGKCTGCVGACSCQNEGQGEYENCVNYCFGVLASCDDCDDSKTPEQAFWCCMGNSPACVPSAPDYGQCILGCIECSGHDFYVPGVNDYYACNPNGEGGYAGCIECCDSGLDECLADPDELFCAIGYELCLVQTCVV